MGQLLLETKYTAKDSKDKREQAAGEGHDLDDREESPVQEGQTPCTAEYDGCETYQPPGEAYRQMHT